MATTEKTKITVEATINAPVEKVWKLWSEPRHIMQWNNASEDWHTPRAENDLRTGGKFITRMEAKDGSIGFDFEGVYDDVKSNELISYSMSDGRTVKVTFKEQGNNTLVTESFDAESMNPVEMQKQGWQAILNNFKKYAEASGKLDTMHFEISINAKADVVYKKMLEDKTYREWTKEFNPTSFYKGSWDKGSKMLFIGTDKNGEESGMVSRIKENIPTKFVSIEHLGLVLNDKEITSGKEVEGWAGALENYTFTEANGKTLVKVDLDANEEFKSYFSETWPKALNALKSICEK
jgi:uncharacterized protein YndB with AHSA1/START domain